MDCLFFEHYKWQPSELENVFVQDIFHYAKRIRKSNEERVIEKFSQYLMLLNIIHGEKPDELASYLRTAMQKLEPAKVDKNSKPVPSQLYPSTTDTDALTSLRKFREAQGHQ